MLRLLKIVLLCYAVAGFQSSCANSEHPSKQNNLKVKMDTSTKDLDTVTFAAGCFWCTEAVFQRLNGVDTVVSGYTGGTVKNPGYKEVCNGTTGHAECIQLVFDKNIISFTELLSVFFKTHDPTTLNYQGGDHGTQYRSGVFYHTSQQKQTAESIIKELNEQKVFNAPIVTELTAFTVFYPAEDYHRNFYNNNPEYGYCRAVINPKLEKLEKYFKDKLK